MARREIEVGESSIMLVAFWHARLVRLACEYVVERILQVISLLWYKWFATHVALPE